MQKRIQELKDTVGSLQDLTADLHESKKRLVRGFARVTAFVTVIIGVWTLLRVFRLIYQDERIHPRDVKLRNAQIHIGVAQNVVQALLCVAWLRRLRIKVSQSRLERFGGVAFRTIGIAYSVIDIYLWWRRYQRRSRDADTTDPVALIALINDRRMLELSATGMTFSIAILLYHMTIEVQTAQREYSRRRRRR